MGSNRECERRLKSVWRSPRALGILSDTPENDVSVLDNTWTVQLLSRSASFPGGNQVDGLPPAPMYGKAGFASRFLAIPLYNLDGTSKLTRGMVIPCRMQNLKSVAALGEKLGPDIVKWKTTFFGNHVLCRKSLLYEVSWR